MSKSAKTCLQCGAKNPATSKGSKVIVGLMVGGFLGLLVVCADVDLPELASEAFDDTPTTRRVTTTTRPTTTQRATTTILSPDAAFMVVTEPYLERVNMSFGEAKDTALGVCALLDEGGSIEDFNLFTLMMAVEGDWSDAEVEAAGAIVGAGVSAFCPEHSWQLP